ncbi:response regulator transcription factor [Pseudonocardia endophytica]|uniref:Regulatory LuxR family protein n=1 Tax=Pseudonocardia endophytica TaxID=401976 RepID=A0A4R1I4C4_PSEEN|nr:helix-turn-helix transcriptional regulator [Pseudonocardia endophytica]TCK27409.1 regulatory LuxR family protein [Pseudonocardia endophytica]
MTRARRLDAEWLDFGAHLLEQPLTALPHEQIARQLIAAFDGVGCSYTSFGDGMTMWPPEFWGGPADYDNAGVAARESTWIHPIVQYLDARGEADAVQIADVPSCFHEAWRARGMDSYYRSMSVDHHLSLPLSVEPGTQAAFVIGRSDAFDDGEMTRAARVRRLLVGLERQASALRAARPAVTSADGGSRGDVTLTGRQLAVLCLAAEGLTAAATGRRLGIAEGTVHKHLQKAYATLGVSDRLSAVLEAQRIGLIVVALPTSGYRTAGIDLPTVVRPT